MKRTLSLLAITAAIVCCTSCVSSKKIVYFQGADELYKEAQAISQQYELKIKPADNILIKISCSNPELLEVFANDVLMGSQSRQATNISSVGSTINSAYGYTVNSNGEVILPIIGAVKIGGKTSEEAGRIIEQAVKEAQLINDPEVTVRLMNGRVAVLGGVSRPGIISLTSERNTIMEILAQCGDVADDGLKTNVKLFREVNGVRTMYTMNLTDSSIFNSPAFYVQQNDLVYVQPNKSKSIKNSAFYTFLNAGSSLVGVTSSLLSVVVVALNLSDRNK